MEVNGETEYFVYGAKILNMLQRYGSDTSEWMRVNADGSFTTVGENETFGLQYQSYRQPEVYYVTTTDTLEGVDLSLYTDIVIKENGVLATELTVDLYVTCLLYTSRCV